MSATKFTLIVQTGPQEGSVFDLDKDTVILGRDVTNNIILSDPEVSRRHSRLTLSPQGYVLEDLGSTNGTFVNGERLSGPHLLIPGDQIGLSQKLVISYELAPEAAAKTVAVEPVVATPAGRIEKRIKGKEAAKPEQPEVIKQPAPKGKIPVRRWIVAGIGCAAITLVCGGIFWYMDAYHDKILYAPIYTLMRILGFQ